MCHPALPVSVGWHAVGEARAQSVTTKDRLPAAIVTNIVILAITGIVALVLLLIAIDRGL